jgi:pimeloyl-ACP methyl ester carboxylesterase
MRWAELEQAAPELARVMIPVLEAYPATVARVRQLDIPAATPTIDIVAERTWVETPGEIEAIRRAHRDFVAASSHRRAVFAEGSGHHVMRDRPELVLDAIAEVVAAVRARP